MSTRTESTVTAITVPSRPFPACSGLRDLLFSNWVRMSLNDSSDLSRGWDSGLPRLDMKAYSLAVGFVLTRITLCHPRQNKRLAAQPPAFQVDHEVAHRRPPPP